MSVMARANSIAFYELLGDAALFNSDRDKYFAIDAEDILNYSRKIFDINNSNTLYYYGETKKSEAGKINRSIARR
jgi:hypothetical protein